MDWKAQQTERLKAEWDRRTELLAMNEAQAMKLSHSDQYQRIRYLREIEAAAWLDGVRKALPQAQTEANEKPLAKRYRGSGRGFSKH